MLDGKIKIKKFSKNNQISFVFFSFAFGVKWFHQKWKMKWKWSHFFHLFICIFLIDANSLNMVAFYSILSFRKVIDFTNKAFTNWYGVLVVTNEVNLILFPNVNVWCSSLSFFFRFFFFLDLRLRTNDGRQSSLLFNVK